jgi:ectoine hydroxylase-related dioxygenase (phytanoyl-CoA dioxygenase family)
MESVIKQFKENGFCILHGILEPTVLTAVKRECEALVAELAEQRHAQGKLINAYPDAPFETRLILLYENYQDETPTIFRPELHREGFFGVFAHRALLELARVILGQEIRLYPNYSVRPKLPENRRTEVLWHQDAGYTSETADVLRMMNVWTPLVPVNVENGCMEFIPGSHKWGVVPHEKDEYYLRIHDDYIKPVEADAVRIEIVPGDVVIFSNLLFHRGLPNRAGHVRWSLDFRYQDARQPTLRSTQGHLLRSEITPDAVVKDSKVWAELEFQ